MGFVVYAEVIRARRASISESQAVEVLTSPSNQTFKGYLAGSEEIWGIVAGQRIYAANYLGVGDADHLIDIPISTSTLTHDWRDAPLNDLLCVEHTAHGWLYSRCDAPFEPANFTWELQTLRLPDRHWSIYLPRYRGENFKLILPSPGWEALELALKIDRYGERKAPQKLLDFMNRFPCWPLDVKIRQADGWQILPNSYENGYEALQPLTRHLMSALQAMDRRLFEEGIVSREIGPGHPVGERWYSVVDNISQEELLLLGRNDALNVPIAWYSVLDAVKARSDGMFKDTIDPEGLVEEWYRRVDEDTFVDPLPGQNSIIVYFMGNDKISSAQVARAVVAAAEGVGLLSIWDGTPESAVTVCLDPVKHPLGQTHALSLDDFKPGNH